MDFTTYLSEKNYILSLALFFIGLMLKKTPNIKNWYIPYILSVLGIVASVIIEGININSIIQGLIAAGIAVYSHQLCKQCIKCISKPSDKSTE